jgi:hypothetical protein
MAWAAEAEKLKGEKTMDMDLIDRAVRQMLNNQLIIMGALDDLIMHGGGNVWAKVHPALTALHDRMASTSAILAQSAEPPKEEA